jgi:hypothetical protein
MDDRSTTSNGDERPLHSDDTQVENLDVLQPGQSPPRSIGMAVKSRGSGNSSNNKGGKPPVPTRVDIADRPLPPITIKADTPKKREASRQNDVLVEKVKATTVGPEAKLGAILRRVNPEVAHMRDPPPLPIFVEEPVDWAGVAILASGLVLVGVAGYFLIKSLSASNVSAASATSAVAETVSGAAASASPI